MRYIPLSCLALSLAAVSLGACAALPHLALSLADSVDRPRDGWMIGGAGFEKGAMIGLSETDNGVTGVAITSPYLGEGVELEGEIVLPAGAVTAVDLPGTESYEIELVQLRYFGNWRRGWTEATFEASGRFRLLYQDGRWKGEVVDPPTIGGITSARLRYLDSYLSGDQALEAVRHRMDRIDATVAVVQEDNDAWFDFPERRKHLFKRERGQSLEGKVGPVLFPEVYGYPAGTWKEGPWSSGDGRKWDTAYTKSRFPEYLHEVRDTGTLFRDWEEALPLWYLSAQWATFWEVKFPAGKISILNDGEQK